MKAKLCHEIDLSTNTFYFDAFAHMDLFYCQEIAMSLHLPLAGDEWLADFSSESRKIVQFVIKSFQKVVHSILNGNALVEHLRIISKNLETFLLLCALLDKVNISIS